MVQDNSGAVVPGATVGLHNTAQNVDRAVTTNSAGYYVILDIIPGNYDLIVSKEGVCHLTADEHHAARKPDGNL